jgi:hypothetical protein
MNIDASSHLFRAAAATAAEVAVASKKLIFGGFKFGICTFK